jgi:ELWxxDGT repeat protein
MRKNVPFQKMLNDRSLGAVVHALAFSILFLAFSSGYGQSQLLGDLNSSEEESYNEYSQLIAADGKVYYVSEGKFLWVSYLGADGVEVTQKIGSFTTISNLTVVGSALYFSANDGNLGNELWKTNGTAAGTVLVKDIRPSYAGSEPQALVNVNGILYLTANNGTHGKEVWKSNGTAAGTVMVKDIMKGSGSSQPAHLTNVNGVVYFAANNGTNGYELWKTNGTDLGTVMVKDIRPELKVSSSPKQLMNVNGTLFFTADDFNRGRELYKSDGTAAGTMIVKDIKPSTQSSSGIENMVVHNGQLFFSADDGIHGHELWKSNGTAEGTVMVKDMTPGAPGSHGEQMFTHRIANFTSIGTYLYFTAYQYDDYFVWKSDGTTAGTTPLFEAGGPGIGQPRPLFTLANGWIYYWNDEDNSEYSYILYRMLPDGSIRHWIYDLYTDAYDYTYPEMVKVTQNGEDFLYFFGKPAFNGFHILKLDRNEEVLFLEDALQATESSNPNRFMTFNGRVYFFAQVQFYESESIIVTDGNYAHETIYFQHMGGDMEASNTHIYGSGRDWLELYRSSGDNFWDTETVYEDYEALPAINLTHVNGNIYWNNVAGEVFKIDGVTKDIAPIRQFQSVKNLTAVGNALVMQVINNNVEELWRTNGLAGGTYKFRTIRSGAGVPSTQYPTATIKGSHYFVANNGTNGNEIWRTGGATSNTVMMADLNPNDNAFVVNGKEDDISTFANFRDSLYVSAVGADGVWGLYKAAATSSSFQKIITMNPIKAMVPVGNKLFLMVYSDDKQSINVHTTNGTAGGTEFLVNVPGAYYFDHAVINGKLYFKTGWENQMWVSDGTACGTFPTTMGQVSHTTAELQAVGDKIIFAGYEKMTGMEPYAYNTALTPSAPACDQAISGRAITSVTTAVSSQENGMQSYPNPFRDEFTFRVNGGENESANVHIVTTTGVTVETMQGIRCNENYSAGKSWPAGLYVMKIDKGNEIVTHKMIKSE